LIGQLLHRRQRPAAAIELTRDRDRDENHALQRAKRRHSSQWNFACFQRTEVPLDRGFGSFSAFAVVSRRPVGAEDDDRTEQGIEEPIQWKRSGSLPRSRGGIRNSEGSRRLVPLTG
jgi:hypothetical protein